MTPKERIRQFRNWLLDRACRICYCHVPKCAGVSLSSAIARQCYRLHERLFLSNFGLSLPASGRAAQVTGRSIREVREGLLAYTLAQQKFKYVTGHLPCGPRLVEEFCDSWRFVTILRNPVDRWISEFVYNTHKSSSWAKNSLPIDEYIESSKAHRSGQTYLRYFSSIADGAATDLQPYIDEAVANLGRFAVVGIFEDLPNFVSRFAAVCGTQLRIPHQNASPRSQLKQQLLSDVRVMRTVTQLCDPDRQVYQRIRAHVSATAGDADLFTEAPSQEASASTGVSREPEKNFVES